MFKRIIKIWVCSLVVSLVLILLLHNNPAILGIIALITTVFSVMFAVLAIQQHWSDQGIYWNNGAVVREGSVPPEILEKPLVNILENPPKFPDLHQP